jgi:hypothetical protein
VRFHVEEEGKGEVNGEKVLFFSSSSLLSLQVLAGP